MAHEIVVPLIFKVNMFNQKNDTIKSTRTLLLAVAVGGFALFSCSPDEEKQPPTIAFNPTSSSTEIDFGAENTPSKNIAFSVVVHADAGIQSLIMDEIKFAGTNENHHETPIASAANQEDYTYNFSKELTNEDFMGITKIEYNFIVTDKEARVADITYTVTVKSYEAPSFNFNAQPKVVAHNFNLQQSYSLAFTLGINAPSKIDNFSIVKSKVSDSGSRENTDVPLTGNFVGQTTFNYSVNIPFVDADFVGFNRIEILFAVTDFSGKQAFDTVKISRIYLFTIVKQGEIYHAYAPEKAAWDLDGDQALASSDPTSQKSIRNIDPNNNGAGSNFTGSWDSGNGTKFVKKNDFDYSSAIISAAMEAYNNGTELTQVINPAVNDIYIAKKDTRYYLIKVMGIDQTSGTDNDGDLGKLTFEYKKY